MYGIGSNRSTEQSDATDQVAPTGREQSFQSAIRRRAGRQLDELSTAPVVQTQRYYGPAWEHVGRQKSFRPDPMSPASSVRWTQRDQEDMKHPDTMWVEPANAAYPLPVLWDTYADHLGGRTKPASPTTIRKYKYTLIHFQRSLELHGDPSILASVTPFAVERWIGDCRKGVIPRFDEEATGTDR